MAQVGKVVLVSWMSLCDHCCFFMVLSFSFSSCLACRLLSFI